MAMQGWIVSDWTRPALLSLEVSIGAESLRLLASPVKSSAVVWGAPEGAVSHTIGDENITFLIRNRFR